MYTVEKTDLPKESLTFLFTETNPYDKFIIEDWDEDSEEEETN